MAQLEEHPVKHDSDLNSNMTKQQQDRLCFLDLPAEIRNAIYRSAFRDTHASITRNPRHDHLDGRWTRKAEGGITRSCWQIHHESLSFLLADFTFSCRLYAQLRRDYYEKEAWRLQESGMVDSYIRHLRLEDWQHSRKAIPRTHPIYCYSALHSDLRGRGTSVEYRMDDECPYCPGRDGAMEHVRAALQTMVDPDGRVSLTREKLIEILGAAAWRDVNSA